MKSCDPSNWRMNSHQTLGIKDGSNNYNGESRKLFHSWSSSSLERTFRCHFLCLHLTSRKISHQAFAVAGIAKCSITMTCDITVCLCVRVYDMFVVYSRSHNTSRANDAGIRNHYVGATDKTNVFLKCDSFNCSLCLAHVRTYDGRTGRCMGPA